MADENTSTASAATDSQASTGQRPPVDSSASGASTSQNDEIKNPEAKARAEEESKYRLQLREAQAKLAEYERKQQEADEAKLSADEKREKKLAEYQQKESTWGTERQQLRLELALAKRSDVPDAAAARHLLLAEHGSEVEYGEDGTPKNLDKLLKTLAEDHPTLFQPAKIPAPSTGAAMNAARSSVTADPQAQLGRQTRLGQGGLFQS